MAWALVLWVFRVTGFPGPSRTLPWPGGVVYTARINPAAATVDVTVIIPRAPHTLRVAFARHPEYDDQVWRDVRDLQVQANGHLIPVAREDSAVWRAALAGGTAVVRYRLALPRNRDNR
jgi:hypothetical protein